MCSCLVVPRVATVPPNRLYYTVNLVANDPSTNPAISWLANTFKGLVWKSWIENSFSFANLYNLCSANTF